MHVPTPPLTLLRRACLALTVLLALSAPGERLPDRLAGPDHDLLTDRVLLVASALPDRLTPQPGHEGDPATLAAFRADPRRDAQSRAARLARTGPPLRAAARVEGHGARAPPMDADRI